MQGLPKIDGYYCEMLSSVNGMAQRRYPKGSSRGGQFSPGTRHQANPATEAAANQASASAAVADLDDRSPSRTDTEEEHWLAIPDEERQALLAEAEKYLAHLRTEVGEPTKKHRQRSAALVESIKRVRNTNSHP